MSEKVSDAIARARAILDQGEKARKAVEASEFSIAATTGRAMISLLADGQWPSAEQVLDLLDALASDSTRLENVTTGSASETRKVISSLLLYPEDR